MRLATSHESLASEGLAGPLGRLLRPAVGFTHPFDVLKDPGLTTEDKRSVLSSWASDASAVQDEPQLRWLLGTVKPVPFSDVREALAHLDAGAGACPEPDYLHQ